MTEHEPAEGRPAGLVRADMIASGVLLLTRKRPSGLKARSNERPAKDILRERRPTIDAFGIKNRMEGPGAFVLKRAPTFTGR